MTHLGHSVDAALRFFLDRARADALATLGFRAGSSALLHAPAIQNDVAGHACPIAPQLRRSNLMSTHARRAGSKAKPMKQVEGRQ